MPHSYRTRRTNNASESAFSQVVALHGSYASSACRAALVEFRKKFTSPGGNLFGFAHQTLSLADRGIVDELTVERDRTSSSFGGLLHGGENAPRPHEFGI